MKGWLLDIYPAGKDEMVLCFKGEDGKARLLRDEYTPEFYIHGNREKLERLEDKLDEREIVESWSYEKKRVRLKDLNKSKVIQARCSSMNELRNLAKRITQLGNHHDYDLYNVDIPYAQDYLHEKNLFPLARVELENPFELEFKLLGPATTTEYELPPLKKAELKIEPEAHGKSPKMKDPVEKISLSLDESETEIEGMNERETILRFVSILREEDPDVILTEGGDSWDLPYLARRAKVNDISERVILDRKPEAYEEKDKDGNSFFSYGKVYYKPPPHYMKGRIHIDTENSFIYEKCGLQGLIELARSTRTPLQKTARSSIGSAMTNLQLYWARDNDVLIPWRKSEPEDFKTAAKLLKADRGGFIHEPEIGIHGDVGEIDFSSFYPKMMEKYNISPETVLCNCCPDSERRVPELDYNICEERKGLIPQVLKPVLKKRQKYKKIIGKSEERTLKEKYQKRQEALKWILVTCFGYLGYRNARFGRIEAHEAVTAFARSKLKEATRIAERKDFKIVHGIVDSLWVKKENVTEQDLRTLCKEIEDETGLPIGLEGKYRWLVFPKGRGENQNSVTNRYYGVFENGELKTRGITARRSDTPDLITRAQLKMLEELKDARGPSQFMEKIDDSLNALRKYLSRIRSGLADPEDLALSRKLSRELDSYQANARSAVAARQLKRIGVNLHPGQQVKYVVTDADADNPNLRVKALQLIDRKKYDREWYVEKLISSAEELLNPFGYDRKNIRNRLLREKKQVTL